ncbi:MAG TPA: ABC transporter permease [Longimicrobiales bacterium]|nr:ABC transporter permease [Longimicrobiales bacterium]
MTDAPLVQLTLWRFREFIREPEAVFWVFLFPILLAMALGIAFRDRPAGEVRISVVAAPGAEALARDLDADPDLEVDLADEEEASRALRTGRRALLVRIAPTIALQFDSTREESRLARVLTDRALQRVHGQSPAVPIREIRSVERGSRYIDFVLPGLIGMNIMGTSMWGVGFGIAQMRQKKLLKRLLASPMRRQHFLTAQILFRLLFLALELAALVGFGTLVFGVPVRGGLATVLLVSVVGALSFSALGLLTASRARTIEGISGIMNFVMMPMWILSGVFFSYARFPEAVQPVIRALPLTALNDDLRAVMIEGSPVSSLLGPMAVLSLWAAVSFVAALRIFRWQ